MLDRGRTTDSLNRAAVRPIVRIHVLGSMRATSFLGDDILPRGRRARAILGSLCLAGGDPLRRGRLSALLWDRVPEYQARASFRQAFRELVVAFGPLASELISADRETIRLNVDLCWIDALALLAAEPGELKDDELAKRFDGELFEDLDGINSSFDQWLLGERTRFTEQRRALFEAQLRQANGPNKEVEERASIARRLIEFDPTHEGASRILMRALADKGERAQALREYARCREALRTTLDIDPSPETEALYDAIRPVSAREEGEKAAPAAVPPKPKPKPKTKVKAEVPAPSRSRLRVGVLPFMVTGVEDSLALSLGQEIASALARFRWFDVIAPVSLMHRTGPAYMADELLRRNQLDYVVDGAVSSSGPKYHITVRLLDLREYASPVWSERFELATDELHRLEEVTAKIVGRIDPVILFIEAREPRAEKQGATGRLMQAIPLFYTMERDKYEKAGRLINEALQLEPENAMVAAWAAYWQLFHHGQGWSTNQERALAAMQKHARNAVRLDPNNAEAQGIYAHICAFVDKDFEAAIVHYDRAFRLNPNLAFIWALSSTLYSYIGEPQKALQNLQRYRDLSPFDPYFVWVETLYTIAYFFAGDYEQAVIVGRRAVKATPDFSNGYKPLLAALGQLGRIEEAKPHLQKVLELEPGFTVQGFGRSYPIKKPADRERYMEGLRKAGVPEGE